MTFKAYDILSSLVPGFLLLIAGLNTFGIHYDKDLIVPYTAVAFLLGFLNNTISSWLEDLYFWTWGGKPSNKLLEGKSVWKVPFYYSEKAKSLLIAECPNQNPSKDELFSIAMRKSNGQERVDNFNALYAFSRALLTTVLIATPVIIITHYTEWRYYPLTIIVFLVLWLRTKQRGYYYAREVLNTYLKLKES